MIIYYNPECSKCQQALEILENNSCEISIRNYLSDPPTVKELKELTALLNCRPADITRRKEPLFVENYEGRDLTDETLYEILAANPILIERPIVINGDKAIIGRPPELVINLLQAE
jgi:arsenate reductase